MSDKDSQTEYEDIFQITRNVVGKKKLFNVELRNWIEAGISIFFATTIILLIPFVPLVKSISILIINIALLYFNMNGIKGCSVSTILFAELKFIRNRRKLHLRSPNYEKNKNTFRSADENLSIAETIFVYIKEHLNEFIERYSSPENSK